jgi:hypothetical protein
MDITAYQYDSEGYLVGRTLVQEDPLNLGHALLPANCTTKKPPTYNAQVHVAQFVDGDWAIVDPKTVPTTSTTPLPKGATADNKPEAGPNQVAVIRDGQWKLVSDYRGTTYVLNGVQATITELDTVVPEGATVVVSTSVADAQCSLLEAAYQDSLTKDFDYAGNTYQGDGTVEQKLTSAVMAYGATTPKDFTWRTADNKDVAATMQDLQAMLLVLVNRRWSAFQKLQVLKAEVRSAATDDEVKAITWDSLPD